MNGVLIDSNVLIDIFTEDVNWLEWSSSQVEKFGSYSILYINPIIYAEISARFTSIEELNDSIPAAFHRLPLPWEAAFLAGKVFHRYKKSGGKSSSPLPDFYIGAHAMVSNLILLTRDEKRYKHYYPKLQLITPNNTKDH